MEKSITLNILGKPVTFSTSRIEACRTGRNAGKPGICPGGHPGSGPSILKKQISGPRSSRLAEVHRLTMRPRIGNSPVRDVIEKFRSVRDKPNWESDSQSLTATYNGSKGRTRVSAESLGFETTTWLRGETESSKKIFRDVNDAFAHAEKSVSG